MIKPVSRDEFAAAILQHKEWKDHLTEGFRISVIQYLDSDDQVKAQAIYQGGSPGPVSISYYLTN